MTIIDNRPSDSESAPATQVVLASRRTDLGDRVTELLEDEHTVVRVIDTVSAIEAIPFAPDLLVIDAECPDFVTPRFLERVRHRWLSVLLVAVAVPGETTATEILDNGADDAMLEQAGWPFVTARLSAIARRMRTANALLRRRVGDVVYDRDNGRVWCAGVEVEFAPRELAVLDALWIRAGELVRHDSLQDYVWSGVDEKERSNRLEVYISYIRRKLEQSNEVMIQTLRGYGYRLVRKNAQDTPWTRDDRKEE